MLEINVKSQNWDAYCASKGVQAVHVAQADTLIEFYKPTTDPAEFILTWACDCGANGFYCETMEHQGEEAVIPEHPDNCDKWKVCLIKGNGIIAGMLCVLKAPAAVMLASFLKDKRQ